jgi:phage terminase large subunit
MQATIVFEKIWNAIHEKNKDGSRKYKYIINTGSSRSSKTFSILQSHYLFALQNPNTRISIWRETKQDTKNTVLADFRKAIVHFPNNEIVSFNKTESIYTFPNKSTIEICGGDDENRVHGFQGDIAHFNEPYKISEETFNQIDMRTSGYILIDWNPKSGHWIDKISKLDNAIVIHSTFKDNPFCPIEQRNKILSYQPIDFSSAVLNGILSRDEALIYNVQKNELQLKTTQLNELVRCITNENTGTRNAFSWQVYGLGEKSEKPNRIFNWNEISDNEYHNLDLPIYYACDWGKVDPWAILEAKYQDGNLYLHEKNYLSENQWREKMNNNERNLINAYDNDEESSQEGIVVWLFEKLNIPMDRPIICDTNRPTKIAILRRKGYDVHLAQKPKGSILDGIDLLDNLNVYYTKSSVNLAHEQENYSRKVDRYGIVLEEPEDKDNHLMDCVRYIATHLQSEGILIKV